MDLATSFIALTRAPRRAAVAVLTLGLVSVAPLLGGCESTDTADAGGDETTGNIQLLDANNYTITSSLTLPYVETASGSDLDICWDGVTSDLQCHDVAPQTDIDNVVVIRFHNLSEEEVQTTLGATDLEMDDVDAYYDYNTDHSSTCAKLSDMSFFGTPIEVGQDYVESDEFTYVMTVTSGTTPGVGAKTLMFLRPNADSTNTTVDAVSGCSDILEASADLHSADAVSVPAEGPWVVDWSDATVDGQGNPISYDSIDGLLLGFYEGMALSDLEDRIFDIEQLATDLWELELSGRRSADLAAARHRETDELYPGFDPDADGTWLMALLCSNCQNPAPIILCVLEPTAGG